MGLLKNYKAKLHIDKEIAPVQQQIRRIPVHTRDKVTVETKRLIKLNIIEPVKSKLAENAPPSAWGRVESGF